MRMFVKFDREGKIVSVCKAEVMAEDVEDPYGFVEERESVIEVEPTGELERESCLEIHEGYRVDVRKKKLVRQR